jgi:hypothetical protein
MKSVLLDLWGVNLASVAILATAFMLLSEGLPYSRVSPPRRQLDDGCPWDQGVEVKQGDAMVVPSEWLDTLRSDTVLTVILASSKPNCDGMTINYEFLVKLAKQHKWALAFDGDSSVALAGLGRKLASEGVLFSANDGVFLKASSRRLLRPQAVVLNSDGVVVRTMEYRDLIGGVYGT